MQAVTWVKRLYTGLDFLGPLLIINRKDKTVEKTYCLLWTCLSTRAVHLELCRNLTVAEFLMCFRRFSNRKSLPSLLLSDNASTFKSSSYEIRKLRSSEKVRTELPNQRVTWQNVTEKAAWFGGAWERLVRSVKRFIKKTIGKTSLDFMELFTLIVEIESILNARPLTFVYSDSDSDICLSYPLTPADLIYGRCLSSNNDKHFEAVITNRTLSKRAKYHRQLLDHFTKRFKREYLRNLEERQVNSRRTQILNQQSTSRRRNS